MGDRLQTGEPYKGLAGAAVSPVLIASQEACDRLETTVMRPSGTRENKQTNCNKSITVQISFKKGNFHPIPKGSLTIQNSPNLEKSTMLHCIH
jgi:hypothetical protein